MPDNISLRDYFAGQALLGIISNQQQLDLLRDLVLAKTHSSMHNGAAVVAYKIADAMIKARGTDV